MFTSLCIKFPPSFPPLHFSTTTILSCVIVVCRPPEQGISLWGWPDLPLQNLGPCIGLSFPG